MIPKRLRRRLLLTLIFAGFALTIPSQSLSSPASALVFFLTIACALLVLWQIYSSSEPNIEKISGRVDTTLDKRWFEAIFDSPAGLLVGSFFLTATLGGLLLSLPIFSAHPHSLPLIDTIFTAFSATCVTGLVVLDTATDFSFAGQLLILVLIQAGGLGIMTLSATVLTLMRRRMSLRHESAIAEILSSDDRSLLSHTTRNIALVTFVTEAIGALILTILFMTEGDGVFQALWRGAFTAISAFCNAGFAIQTDNLVTYQNSPLILQTVALLIILGGLSPLVIISLPGLRQPRRLSLHTSLTLITTAFLLVAPAIFITFAEWSNTLAGMNLVDSLTNAWFQTATTRTAGFNSLDLAALRPSTVLIMMLLMFIGGSPASTAGGVKTTTFAVLILVVFSALRGREKVLIFGYHIPTRTIFKATAVVTMGAIFAISATVVLLATQQLELVPALFEVISAIATVGLSVGATEKLDSVGKIVICFCMLAGRVGPLTLFVLLTTRAPRYDWDRPEQPVIVG